MQHIYRANALRLTSSKALKQNTRRAHKCAMQPPALTSSSGRRYFSTSTRSRGQKRSFLMCRSSPWRVKKSLEYLPALHTRRGITPSSSMNKAMWSSSLQDRQHGGE